MPDSRFFTSLGPIALGDLADRVGARLAAEPNDETLISGVAPLVRAGRHEVTFLSDRRYDADLKSTRAGAAFLTEAYAAMAPAGCVALITPEPQAAYVRACVLLHGPREHEVGAPAIHPDCELEPDVILEPGVVIGQGARIGAGTRIGANTVIGPGVAIGRNSWIGANAVVGFALIGDRVRIYAGAIIGAEGFGVTGSGQGAIDIPQLGRVVLQDDVTIGANTCIDRGAWDDTIIGERTKIDNLVQIAHNVRIGRNCLIAAHTGISGSSVVGDGAMFGGRAGVVDHVTVGQGARIGAAAGVMKDVPAGETWSGVPARPVLKLMREFAWLSRQVSLSRPGERKKGGQSDDQ